MSSERLCELLHAYLAARYCWQDGDLWRPLCIGTTAPEVESALPHARCFALLSAFNPGSIPHDPAFNQRADTELREALHEAGLASRPATGSAPDGSWLEPGWLVSDLPDDLLQALMSRFGQLGALAWRRGSKVRLVMNAAKPPDRPASPDVAWLK